MFQAHEENERDDVGVESKNRQSNVPSSSLKLNRKRNSDSDMYLSAEEKVDLNKLIASQDSYIFPRDDQLNYICVFQGTQIINKHHIFQYHAHKWSQDAQNQF